MYRSRLGKKLDDITLSYVSSMSDDSDIAFYDILSQKSSISIAKYLNPNSTIYDLIYTPRPTKWLKLGEECGCKTIDGLEMLIQQGAASLNLWTGVKEMPIQLMRKAAINALNS